MYKRQDTYSQHLNEHVKTPTVPIKQESVWAQYSIQVEDREKLKADLHKEGIPTATFYPTPIHLSLAYADLGYKKGDFPISESISKRIISLPMHPFLKKEEILKICDTVNSTVSK